MIDQVYNNSSNPTYTSNFKFNICHVDKPLLLSATLKKKGVKFKNTFSSKIRYKKHITQTSNKNSALSPKFAYEESWNYAKKLSLNYLQ